MTEEVDSMIKKYAKQASQELSVRIQRMSKKELLTKLLRPKYARRLKDFTKEEILECVLKNYKKPRTLHDYLKRNFHKVSNMISQDEFKEKFNEVMSLDGAELADFLNALVEAGKDDIARELFQQWKIRRES